MAASSLIQFGHTGSLRLRRRRPLGAWRFLADVVKLEAAEWAPVNIPADPFLQVTQRVLVHRVDVVDAAQLLHSKTSAARATAGPSEQEQEPLVARLAPAAFLALQDGVIAEFVEKRSLNTDQNTPATRTLPREPFISKIAKTWQLAGAFSG
jgi:hypothetical protein